jgi:hypothetical protein
MRRCFLLLAVVLLLACDSDQPHAPASATPATISPSPTDTPTPQIEPLAISKPLPASNAYGEDFRGSAWFVVDRTTGLAQVIQTTPNPCLDRPPGTCSFDGGIVSASWLDEETLLMVPAYGPAVALTLDGRAAAWLPTQSPLPSTKGDRSASKIWIAAQLSSGAGGVLVGKGTHDNPQWLMRVAGAHQYAWAPESDRLAMLGNRCVGFDAFVLNPETETVNNLTAASDPAVTTFVWRPTGDWLTVAAYDTDAGLSSIASISPDGTREPLVSIEGLITFDSLAWDPSGTKLLFRATRGGTLPACEAGAVYPETYLDPVPNFGGP